MLLLAAGGLFLGLASTPPTQEVAAPSPVAATQSAVPAASGEPTPSPAVMAAATASETTLTSSEEQLVEETATTAVELYSALLCANRARQQHGVDAVVQRTVTRYAADGLSEHASREITHRVLTGSAARSCPELSALVADAVATQ